MQAKQNASRAVFGLWAPRRGQGRRGRGSARAQDCAQTCCFTSQRPRSTRKTQRGVRPPRKKRFLFNYTCPYFPSFLPSFLPPPSLPPKCLYSESSKLLGELRACPGGAGLQWADQNAGRGLGSLHPHSEGSQNRPLSVSGRTELPLSLIHI